VIARRRLVVSLAAASTVAWFGAAAAQEFPSRPFKIIVPFAPGGSTDVLARMVGKHLGERTKQPVVIENRPGAGGNVGADAVAKSAPDGYTLVMGSIGTHATNGLMYATMPYDALRDFAPVALVGRVTLVLVVHPTLPARSVGELVELLRSKPNEYSYASGGIGASQHLAAELFKFQTKSGMQHVPYKGSAGALADLLAGRVPVMFADLPLVLQHIQSGSLRALAVADTERSPVLPDVPTVAQTVPGYAGDRLVRPVRAGSHARARVGSPARGRRRHHRATRREKGDGRHRRTARQCRGCRPASVPGSRDPALAGGGAGGEHPARVTRGAARCAQAEPASSPALIGLRRYGRPVTRCTIACRTVICRPLFRA
jgi:tripartite-type tricarboxylate transporter receptor subunit TctC